MNTPNTTVYQSQGARDVPSSIYTEGTLWNTTGNNDFWFYDTCSGCDFLPGSSAEINLMVPSFVPYGKVFETKADAINDAIQRLKNVLGTEVDALEISNDTLTTGNIPWMYGPLLLEVRVWV